MVNFKLGSTFLRDAFNMSEEEVEYIAELTERLMKEMKCVTWGVQRIWIDENLTDNGKCWMVFMLGQWYEREIIKRRGR